MQEEESSSSFLQAQSSKRKRVTESASGHELVPDQAGGANTIGANNQEQWWNERYVRVTDALSRAEAKTPVTPAVTTERSSALAYTV